jgi:hypothetical protein
MMTQLTAAHATQINAISNPDDGVSGHPGLHAAPHVEADLEIDREPV